MMGPLFWLRRTVTCKTNGYWALLLLEGEVRIWEFKEPVLEESIVRHKEAQKAQKSAETF